MVKTSSGYNRLFDQRVVQRAKEFFGILAQKTKFWTEKK
jgi:hypothetical protein